MVWRLHSQQQQRGAQLHARSGKPRRAGEAPADAVAGREAQEHEHAAREAGAGEARPGESLASPIENRDQDPSTGLRTGVTRSAPEPDASWDAVVQPERRKHPRGRDWEDQPLPEGK